MLSWHFWLLQVIVVKQYITVLQVTVYWCSCVILMVNYDGVCDFRCVFSDLEYEAGLVCS